MKRACEENYMWSLDKCLVFLLLLFECNPTLALFDIVQYLIFSLICFRLCLLKSNIFLNDYTKYYFYFTIWCIFSLLWSVSFEDAVGNIVMVIKCLLIFLYFTNVKISLRFVCFIYVIINSIDALVLLPNIDLMSILERGSRGTHVVMGVTWSINIICTMFSFSVFFLFLFYTHEKNAYRKSLYLLISAPLFYDIFLLGSRQALILSFGSIILYYVIKGFQKPTQKNILRILLTLSLVALILTYVINDPFLNQTIGRRLVRTYIDEASDNGRIELIREGFSNFLYSPLLGTGLGSYRILIHNVNAYAHNNYIELLVSCGVVGCAVYHAMIFSPIANIRNKEGKLTLEQKNIVYVLVIMVLFSEMVIVTYQVFQYQFMIYVAFMISKYSKTKNYE